MAGMPAMEEKEELKKPKGKGVDLAIVFGGKPKAGKPEAEAEPDSDDELPAGFEDAFAEAFPDMAGDTERMMAMKRLIHLCTDSY